MVFGFPKWKASSTLRRSERNFKPKLIIIAVLLLCGAGGWLLWIKLEGTPPVVSLDLPQKTLNAETVIPLTVNDADSGLRRLRVTLTRDGREAVLAEKTYPLAGFLSGGADHRDQLSLKADPEVIGGDDGPAEITVTALDYAWRRWWNGNRTILTREVVLDNRPPDLRVESDVHNMAPGGSGLVIYSLSEPCPEHGVRVGETFFPGYSADSIFKGADRGVFMAFIALAPDQGPGTDLAVRAVDAAGNESRAGFRHYIRNRSFQADVIRISDGFLDQTLPEFANEIPDSVSDDPLDRFLWINRELRRINYEEITAAARQTDARLYWEGPFLRLPNAARRAAFADRRTYRYGDEVIDHQTHLGIDLASLAQAPVPAANAGRVAFTGRIGIYGKTVMIDHGFGLFSTYSHLSGIDVAVDDSVAPGDIIGQTGKSGLAGGDHLHFGILIHNTFTDPVEWWDDNWIRHNVTDKIEAVRDRWRG
jgi:hypothetical protein